MKNKKIIYLLSFMIPILLILSYIFLYKIKFTDFFISDLKEQYSFIFDYYKEILNGNQSILYSFSNGLGGSMYGTFFYYLSSPLNLLLILFSTNYLYIGIVILILLKIGLSGLTMYYYLSKTNNNSSIINLTFSCCYALMSYNMLYYFNVIWLDVVYLTPLVILGVDEIIQNKKSKKYILFLVLSIISNWYISYMLCMFIVIYFIFRLFNTKENRQEIIKKFIISNVLVGLICSFILIPVIFELLNKNGNNYEYSTSFIEKIMFFINNIGINLKDKNNTYYIFNIYCGIFPLVILLDYLIFVKDKEKTSILVVIIILLLSLFIPLLTYIWHGFSYPVVFNHRWTFLFSFFVINIVSKKYFLLKTIKNQLLLITPYFIVLLIGVLLDKNIDITLFIINLFFFFSYMKLFNFSVINKKYEMAILILVLIESFIFIKTNFISNISIKKEQNDIEYATYINEKEKFLDKINDLNAIRISGMIYSPIEKLGINTGNVTNFLTTRDSKFYMKLSKIGYISYENETYDNINNCLINSMLGIKYLYGTNLDNYCYKKIDSLNINNKEYYIYENNHNISIGYLINKNKLSLNSDNSFENLNKFGRLFIDKNIYNIIYNENGYYQLDDNDYICLENIAAKEIKVIINDKIVYEEKYADNNLKIYSFISVKNEYKNQKIKLDIYVNNKKINNYYIATFNTKNYDYLFEEINGKLENIKIDKNTITGDIIVQNENQKLMLTIPYDKNWNIYIDNQKINYSNIVDMFITFDINKGYHQIKLVYFPKYIIIGYVIFILGIILLKIYFNKSVK